jgi:D-serine deaminase-like pyridoxal phosphate-dependent protein
MTPLRIRKPTLILNRDICTRNIATMVQKAKKHRIRLRPHFKTHQSATIGEWFRAQGVNSITVSSVTMAGYFAAHGWEDITLAFPVNLNEAARINRLAGKIRLNLTLESPDTVTALATQVSRPVGVYIKIDTGYHRTGIPPGETGIIDLIIDRLRQTPHRFKGFLTHAGHTYHAAGRDEIISIHQSSRQAMVMLGNRYRESTPGIELSVGDTPSCSLADDFRGLDEIRPGNFVFYDLMQYRLGSCTQEDIALALACPVVAKHPARQELVVYGGANHLSKESLRGKRGKLTFGGVVTLGREGWSTLMPGTSVVSLSQEHGVIRMGDTASFTNIATGDIIGIIPVHACLTANLMRRYLTLGGETIGMMPV